LMKLIQIDSSSINFCGLTDTNTGERTTHAKANEAAIDNIKMIAGDVIHNLRSTIDYVYRDIVHPFVDANKSRKMVQFAFTSRAEFLNETVAKRHTRREWLP